MKQRTSLMLVGFAALSLWACKRGYAPDIPDANYPADVNRIVLTKCATSGCHSRTDYQQAGGLLLDSWDHLFNGGNNGAAVVPYRPENSPLLYYINNGNFPELQRHHPALPSGNPVTDDEYKTIKNWIAGGAADKDGNIAFASDAALRQKIYLIHAGQDNCKLLAVIDGGRKVVMRYVPIGTSSAAESAHSIRVSHDGLFAYLSLHGNPYLMKLNASTDQIVDSLNIGNKSWGVINLSDDGKKLVLGASESNGTIIVVNTETMAIEQQFSGANQFINPHGIAGVSSFDTFYVASSSGNVVYKQSLDGKLYSQISIDGAAPTHTSVPGSTPDPFDLAFNPDYTRLFISCPGTNEVRVFDARRDTLLRAIPVGKTPQYMAVSQTSNYIFIACMNDDNGSGAGYKGSVYVIDFKTLNVVRKIEGPFSEPASVAVDDAHGLFYVISSNRSAGFTGANTSVCGKPNGWYSVYDLKTLQPVAARMETASNPYFADTRFK